MYISRMRSISVSVAPFTRTTGLAAIDETCVLEGPFAADVAAGPCEATCAELPTDPANIAATRNDQAFISTSVLQYSWLRRGRNTPLPRSSELERGRNADSGRFVRATRTR